MNLLPDSLRRHLLPRQDASIEQGLFHWLSLAGSLVAIFVIPPLNVLQGLPSLVNLAVVGFGVFTFALYLASRRGRYLVKSELIALLVLLDVIWFPNGGSEGSIGFFFFTAAMYAVIFFRDWTRWGMLSIFLLNSLGLYLAEMVWPWLPTRLADAQTRILDLVTGFLICTAVCLFILWTVLDRYYTEHKRLVAAAATHAKHEAKLQEAVELALLGHWEHDHVTGKVAWSEQLFRNFRRDPALGAPDWTEYQTRIHPQDRSGVEARWSGHLAGRTPACADEYRLLFPDGEIRHIRTQWRTAFNPYGVPLRTLGTDQDITLQRRNEEERLRIEKELNHLQRLESVGRLAAGVSHDMNNVLAGIMGVGSLLKLKYPSDPAISLNADRILEATTRGRDLVKSLTDFSRKDLQDPRPLDLNLLVRKEVDLLNSTTLKRLAISTELDPNLRPVLGEANALSNVLMNLCVNAKDAMPQGGGLCIRTRNHPDGCVELSVEDTGQGMTPEVQARAMEPFFTTKPAGVGTGLGLSIVYGTVIAHGGTVEIHSRPGEGTRISAIFPSVAPSESGAPLAPDLESKPPAARHVLLVDDDDLVRRTTRSLLEELGHRVHCASSGLAAVRSLEAGLEVDLVLLDLNMPGMDGLQTLERIRLVFPELPVIVSSGYCDEATRSGLDEFRHVGMLGKPFSLAALEQALSVEA